MQKKEVINAIENFNEKGFDLKIDDITFCIPDLIEEDYEKVFLLKRANQDLYFAIYPKFSRYIYIQIYKNKLIIKSKTYNIKERYIYTNSQVVFDIKNSNFIKLDRKNKSGEFKTAVDNIAVLQNGNDLFMTPLFFSFKNHLKKFKNLNVTNKYKMSIKGNKIRLFGINTSKIKSFKILMNGDTIVGEINTGVLFSSGSIDGNLLYNSDKIHTPIHLSIDGVHKLYPLNIGGDKKIINKFEKSIRIQMINNNLIISIIPFSKENLFFQRILIQIAKFLAKFGKKNKILMFEKFSKNAQESGIRVFEKLMEKNLPNTFFILDKSSDRFDDLKKIYPHNIIEKNSFKHYYYFFRANYAISSELPTHMFNDRIFNRILLNQSKKIKFIFLQHGIMLGKPIFNPMALGFHKKNNGFNIKKTVVCSHLEAEEFYKMGYNKEDLMFTGLATLDYAKLDKGAQKIIYMPTYRYWEESYIYSNQIEKTSYYKDLMQMIEIFKKNNLLDRLLVVPHNKFSEYIYTYMHEYKDIISSSPTEALKQGKIFITDYSSAIYDAQFRGAYPIFYWEHKEELIKNYRAVPTLDENIASGPCVYSKEELIEVIKKVIDNNYILEKEYKEKYLKINEFTDRKNSDRIYKEIIKIIKD